MQCAFPLIANPSDTLVKQLLLSLMLQQKLKTARALREGTCSTLFYVPTVPGTEYNTESEQGD